MVQQQPDAMGSLEVRFAVSVSETEWVPAPLLLVHTWHHEAGRALLHTAAAAPRCPGVTRGESYCSKVGFAWQVKATACTNTVLSPAPQRCVACPATQAAQQAETLRLHCVLHCLQACAANVGVQLQLAPSLCSATYKAFSYAPCS
jgi:hypothetical protein